MVSTKQDASTITYFFLSILADGAPSPQMIVIDFSKALLMAVIKAFANCADTYTYLEILYNIIVLEKNEKLPSCYVRLNVNHFIGMVARWDCLHGKVLKVRQFYIRSIGHIYKMSDVRHIKSLLTSIMVVALSEDIGCNKNNDIIPSEYHLKSVNDVIKETLIEDPIDETESPEETLFENSENGWTECVL